MAIPSRSGGGETCTVVVDDPPCLDGAALSLAGVACIDKLISLRNVGDAGAAASLQSCNETWRQEGDEVLDRAGFEDRLAVSSIEVLDESDCGTVYVSDGGTFMGHRVAGRSRERRWSWWS